MEGQAWTSDPWTLTERDGRLYGRGTTDMKGFDALALALVPEWSRPTSSAGPHRPVVRRGTRLQRRALMVRAMAEASDALRGRSSANRRGMRSSPATRLRHSCAPTVTGHAVHSSRIDQGVSAVMTGGPADRVARGRNERNRASARSSNPFEPPYTTLHCGVIRGDGRQHRCDRRLGSTRTSARSRPRTHGTTSARYRAYAREAVVPAMKAIAPEAGVDGRAGVPRAGLEARSRMALPSA